MTKSILVLTDFSLVCENALIHAAGITRQIGANLIIAHVINSDTRAYLKKNKQSKETVSDYLRDYQVRLAEEFSLRVDIRVLEGKITEQIPSLVKELGIDLLMFNAKLSRALFIAKSFGATVKLFVYNEKRENVRAKMELILVRIRETFLARKINFTEDIAKFETDFPKQIMEFSISNNAQLITIKVDNDEFEPSFIVGSPEEKILFNTAQIPIFCAQQKP